MEYIKNKIKKKYIYGLKTEIDYFFVIQTKEKNLNLVPK
jgi:hypothetical protein